MGRLPMSSLPNRTLPAVRVIQPRDQCAAAWSCRIRRAPATRSVHREWMVRSMRFQRRELAERPCRCRATSNLHSVHPGQCPRAAASCIAVAATQGSIFTASGTSANSASSDATAKAADEIVFLVQDLDVQRHGVGQAADVAGDHPHRPELAHGARGAQQHAIQQGPLDRGAASRARRSASRKRPTTAKPALRRCPVPASAGSVRAPRRGRSRTRWPARCRQRVKMILMIVVEQERPRPALAAEDQDVDQRPPPQATTENGRSISENAAASCRGTRTSRWPGRPQTPNTSVQRHGDRRDQQRELHRRLCIRLQDGVAVGLPAIAQGLEEHRKQWQQQEPEQEQHRDRDQHPLHPAAFRGDRLYAAPSPAPGGGQRSVPAAN